MSACVQAGCPGTYGPEGYCDECGRKAPAGVGAAVGGPAGTGTGTMATGTMATGTMATGTMATGPTATTGTGVTGRTTSGSTGRRSSRGGLGAGLLDMPRVPLRDPASAVMANPQVLENRRFCVRCDKPVGRSRNGRPGLVEGFCPNDGTPFSFLPRLSAGDLVNDRYEILGCLAYGGLGWIYLARDRNVSDSVSDRWVVLKGLINSGDADAMAAAVAERRFLVDVDHPTIVKIHDFVQHPDPKTGAVVGYIVMEYVGGRSLRDILLSHREQDGPGASLPLPQVLAYGAEILPALDYLHDRDLLFCDFKPDNVIHAEEQLKLIDLGAVRHADDDTGAVWGTPGYQAPEVARVGPSVASDIYTVGRALAVLSFNFAGFSTRYADSLPAPPDVALFAREESYYRLLRRATHRDPARRFQSAAEMREQLLGVLREVLSAVDGAPRPTLSSRFTLERGAFGTYAGAVDDGAIPDGFAGSTIVASLPLPQVDLADPGAGFLASLSTTDPDEFVRTLDAAPVNSVEVALRLVLAYIERGDLARAGAELDALAAADPGDAANPVDWRVDWYRGLAALAADRPADAAGAFNAVYDALPGESAPKLALAVALEWSGDTDGAARRYERVWRADRGYVSAAFGLARIRLAAGDRAGAVTVLDEVPDSSRYQMAAQVAAVRARLAGDRQRLVEADLLDASARLERLGLDIGRQARLAVETLEAALEWAGDGRPPGTGRVVGHELTERSLRFGLERAYRTLAKVAQDPDTRIALVDRANAVRPRTLV
jgi:serine/threonine-protein kinase PknG